MSRTMEPHEPPCKFYSQGYSQGHKSISVTLRRRRLSCREKD